jgi:hypothetical protein
MATMTYFVALGFKRSEDGGEIVACDPKECVFHGIVSADSRRS